MTSKNILLGKKGEKIALAYLRKNNYLIVDQNKTVGHGEIDIIAKKENLYIFIEVKTRESENYVDILDSIGRRKEENLIASCERYLASNSLSQYDFRIDLIGIVLRREKVVKFEHVRGII